MRVTRYSTQQQPDRLRIEDETGVILDISMSGDSPLRPAIRNRETGAWFFNGSPHGAEIMQVAQRHGLVNLQPRPYRP